jgi:hypothetical protein
MTDDPGYREGPEDALSRKLRPLGRKRVSRARVASTSFVDRALRLWCHVPVSEVQHDASSTVFGSLRRDIVAFCCLLLVMLYCSRRLEVYSRMPSEDTPAALEDARPRSPAASD